MTIDVDINTLATNHPNNYGQDKAFTLYYDESNNPRKLLLRESGLNIKKHDNYVLGGIALEPGQDMPEIQTLRRILRIQPTAPEIKFEHVAKGDFETALKSTKLEQTLNWLISEKISIHYTNLNILNWATLDIIESIVADKDFSEYIAIHRELKNELYRIVMMDLAKFLTILNTYAYPNIAHDEVKSFIKAVKDFVLVHYPLQDNEFTKTLKYILLIAQDLPELAFLTNEKPYSLIDSFHHFFINRISTFKNATHVFDEEKNVQTSMQKIRLMDGANEISFSFENSKTTPGVQLSDIVMGLVGRYFTFIEKTSMAGLASKRRSLNSIQTRNLSLLRRLINISDKSSNALLFQITTLDSEAKHYYFMTGNMPGSAD